MGLPSKREYNESVENIEQDHTTCDNLIGVIRWMMRDDDCDDFVYGVIGFITNESEESDVEYVLIPVVRHDDLPDDLKDFLEKYESRFAA